MDVEAIDVQCVNKIPLSVKIRMGNVVIKWRLGKNGRLKELSRSKPGCRVYNSCQLCISSGLYAQGVRQAYAILRA